MICYIEVPFKADLTMYVFKAYKTILDHIINKTFHVYSVTTQYTNLLSYVIMIFLKQGHVTRVKAPTIFLNHGEGCHY